MQKKNMLNSLMVRIEDVVPEIFDEIKKRESVLNDKYSKFLVRNTAELENNDSNLNVYSEPEVSETSIIGYIQRFEKLKPRYNNFIQLTSPAKSLDLASIISSREDVVSFEEISRIKQELDL